jgi:hypothetical protein
MKNYLKHNKGDNLTCSSLESVLLVRRIYSAFLPGFPSAKTHTHTHTNIQIKLNSRKKFSGKSNKNYYLSFNLMVTSNSDT